MNITTKYENRRILLIDDNEAIHEDFRKILCPRANDDSLVAAEAELFGDETASDADARYELVSALQGSDGLALVKDAVERGTPFAVAFVDVRMPPGWDGVETVERIWQVDPRLQVVLCTAFSDHSWQQIVRRLGRSDQFLILKKPFDVIEAQQLALTLTTKWNLARAAEGHEAALEASVEMKTRQLAKVRQAADAVVQARNQSLVRISQGFRPPMNAILQFAEQLMEQGDISKAPPVRVEAINTILHSGKRLLVLIDNLFDYSKIETGRMELVRVDFDLHEVVRTTVKTFAAAAARKSLDLRWQIDDSVPRHVVGDASRLAQILSNLIDNAIEFTEQGSVDVRVTLESVQDPITIVRFAINDTGIGIAMDQLDRLFQPFSQVEGPSGQRSNSAGLGLAISRRLVELHGGNIEVCSAPGEGSTFEFTVELIRTAPTDSLTHTPAVH